VRTPNEDSASSPHGDSANVGSFAMALLGEHTFKAPCKAGPIVVNVYSICPAISVLSGAF
jgi:hypothetical protein